MIPEQFLDMSRAYRLLSELEPEQLRKLVPLAQERRFASGEFIFREGDQSSFLYLIVSGEVALEMVADGETVCVQRLQPGEALGWSALTTDSRTHFQARALSPVETVAFPSLRIREACERDPEMGHSLMKRLLEVVTERLDATRMQVINLHRLQRSPEAARQG